jgi:hypothetical protein
MSYQSGVPVLRQVVLDTTDVRDLAEFAAPLVTGSPSRGASPTPSVSSRSCES